jgi:hypothetical protein
MLTELNGLEARFDCIVFVNSQHKSSQPLLFAHSLHFEAASMPSPTPTQFKSSIKRNKKKQVRHINRMNTSCVWYPKISQEVKTSDHNLALKQKILTEITQLCPWLSQDTEKSWAIVSPFSVYITFCCLVRSC